jgi:hypothetical protein
VLSRKRGIIREPSGGCSSGLYESKSGTKLWPCKMAASGGWRGVGQLFAQLWRGHGNTRARPIKALPGTDSPAFFGGRLHHRATAQVTDRR